MEAEMEEEGAGSAGSAGVPEADWGSGGGSGEESEPEESEPIPIDPLCDDLTTPADFGLGEGFRTYTGWIQEELEQHECSLVSMSSWKIGKPKGTSMDDSPRWSRRSTVAPLS